MGRPGYEQEFKKKLEARGMKPRADSWDKLEKQLERTEYSRRTIWQRWPAIVAASVCLLFFLGFMFRTTSDPVQVVEQQGKTQENTPLTPKSYETEEKLSESVAAQTTVADKQQPKNQPLSAQSSTNQEIADAAVSENAWIQQEKTDVLLAQQVKELGLAELLLEENISDDVLWQKLDEVLLEAGRLTETTGEVSDAEIDALLLLAAEDISRSRPSQETAISADALLYEVEMELEESFRQRVFDLLKQGLDKTRTAVVNSMQ